MTNYQRTTATLTALTCIIAITGALPTTSRHHSVENGRTRRDVNTTQCLNRTEAIAAYAININNVPAISAINDASTCSTGSSLLDTSGLSGIDELSLCPWVYRVDINSRRYPVNMMFAQCRCTHCIKTDGSDFDTIHGNQCKTVKHEVKVLRECEGSCEAGECRYHPDYEDVPVACTCVRQATV